MTILEWRPIPDFQMYDVSSFGDVRSWKTQSGRKLSIFERAKTPRQLTKCVTRTNYFYVCISDDSGKFRRRLVHQLVCEAFLPDRPNDATLIRHIDGNRLNNRIDNLSWGTAKDNSEDSKLHGTMLLGSRKSNAKLSDEDVIEILTSNLSNTELARKFGVTQGHVSRIRNGYNWRHIDVSSRAIAY